MTNRAQQRSLQRKPLTFDQIVSSLRSHGFDVREGGSVANELTVEKYGAAALLRRESGEKPAALEANPGYMIGGEIARLVDRGHQKFFETSKVTVPATAEHLRSIHRFSEEVRELIGSESLYNESLGTVSDKYLYDRVKGRDLPVAKRPKPIWEQVTGNTKQP